MAITSLAPAVTRSRKILTEKTAEVALRLVPEPTVGKQADRKFFAVFVSIVGITGLMFLLLHKHIISTRCFQAFRVKGRG
jgi:hypothetical protein